MYFDNLNKFLLYKITYGNDIWFRYHELHEELWNRVINKLKRYEIDEHFYNLDRIKASCVINMKGENVITFGDYNSVRMNCNCFACAYAVVLNQTYSYDNYCTLCPIHWSKMGINECHCCNTDSSFKKLQELLSIGTLKSEKDRKKAIELAETIMNIEWRNTDV